MGDKFQSDEVESTVVTNYSNLNELPSGIIWELLQFLDTDSIVALAGTDTTLRGLIVAKYNLSVSIPFTLGYYNHLLDNPYSHNKPVLRMRISRLRPDFIRQDKEVQPSTIVNLHASQQLLLTNLSNLTHVCLHLEQTEVDCIAAYRVAYLGMLQSIGLFKKLSKLHLTLSQLSFLDFEPGTFGTRIVKDALLVKHLVITIIKNHSSKDKNRDSRIFTTALQKFISSVKSKSLVLDIGRISCSKESEVLDLTNNNVEEFKLIAPCLFKSKLTMENLKVLNIATNDQKCTLDKFGHRVGRCVLNSSSIIDGCPCLEKFAGVEIRELKELESLITNMPKSSLFKKRRCGECESCKNENCGKCRNCRDMKQFGGENRLRQACEMRRCEAMLINKNSDAERLPVMKVQPWKTSISCTI